MIQYQISTSKLSSSFRPSCHLENSLSQLSTVLRGQTTRAVEKFNFSHNRIVWRNVTTCRTHTEQQLIKTRHREAFHTLKIRAMWSHLQGFTQTHTMSQNTAGAHRLLHLSDRLTAAVPHELNTCAQITTSPKRAHYHHNQCPNQTSMLNILFLDDESLECVTVTSWWR